MAERKKLIRSVAPSLEKKKAVRRIPNAKQKETPPEPPKPVGMPIYPKAKVPPPKSIDPNLGPAVGYGKFRDAFAVGPVIVRVRSKEVGEFTQREYWVGGIRLCYAMMEAAGWVLNLRAGSESSPLKGERFEDEGPMHKRLKQLLMSEPGKGV